MRTRLLFAPLAVLLLTVSALAAAPSEILALSGAKGAILLECETGRTLAAKNEHERLPVASTTKIMTALLALEHGNLDEPFVVDPDVIHVEGTSMGLQEGDTVTLRALVCGMLLASGNDAANAAAVRVAGGLDEFVSRMNGRAAELGMTDTLFVSPSGLETGKPYSSAYDMARLACAALQNELFAELAASESASVSYGNPPYPRRLTNHNRLLSLCDGAIGVKTGFTKAAGRCLVSAVRRDGLTLVAVTLNCPDDFRVHQTLYDEAFASLTYVDYSALASGFRVRVTGAKQTSLPLAAAKPLGAYLTEDERKHVALSLLVQPFLYAPVKAGETVGEIALTLSGERIASVPAVSVEDRDFAFPDNRSIVEKVHDFFHFPSEPFFPFFIFED